MAHVIPWSYSSLTSFEICPRKHYEERIAKSVKRTSSPAAEEGTLLHKMVEDYLNEGKEFEHRYKEQIIEALEELQPSQILPEYKIAVTRELTPTTWEAEDCYARGLMDVFKTDCSSTVVGDWKTGRSDPFSTQLKLSALMVLAHYPEVSKVNTKYYWLKEQSQTKMTIHRDFMLSDWEKFVKRAAKLERALEQNEWPEKPSGLCKNYCDVKACKYNG
jgi:hypothetical protein